MFEPYAFKRRGNEVKPYKYRQYLTFLGEEHQYCRHAKTLPLRARPGVVKLPQLHIQQRANVHPRPYLI